MAIFRCSKILHHSEMASLKAGTVEHGCTILWWQDATCLLPCRYLAYRYLLELVGLLLLLTSAKKSGRDLWIASNGDSGSGL
jgi:hypothetical protein